MPDVSKLRLDGVSYDIKDDNARKHLVMVNEEPVSATKVVVNTSDDQIELALQSEVDASIAELNSAITNIRGSVVADIQTAVNAEKMARQQVDNSLQSSINSEVSSRTTADASLQSQINQIVAPSGEAPSAAEVENARVGDDGVTYATIGDAIRSNDQYAKNVALQTTEKIPSGTYTLKEYVIDKQLLHKCGASVIVVNESSSNGYFRIQIRDANNTIISSSSMELLSNGQKLTQTYPINYSNVFDKGYNFYSGLKFTLETPNKSACHIVISYNRSNAINTLISKSYEIDERVFGDDGAIAYGHIDSNGNVVLSNSDNRIIAYNNVKFGDKFVYTGGYGWGVVWGYYSDGTPVNILPGLKDYHNYVFSITDENIVMVRGWGTVNSSSEHPDVSFKRRTNEPLNLVVDLYNRGSFTDIQSAIDYAKKQIDVVSIPVTIYIKNGEYILNPTSEAAYVLNKGANKISLVGESREHTIITLTSTPALNNKVIEFGGHCVLSNLTIKNLWHDDGSVYSGTNNAYCVHNDAASPYTTPYTTTIENCYIYSEAFCPVGGGLQNYQTQIYRNCIFEYNSKEATGDYSQHGALYVHAPSASSAVNCALEVDNCVCISKCGTKAIDLPDVSGSISYKNIPVTIRRTIGVTNGSVMTNVTASTHDLTADCKLNSHDDWNV